MRRGRKLSVEAAVAGGVEAAVVTVADAAVAAVVEAVTAAVADAAEIVETAETAGNTSLPN